MGTKELNVFYSHFGLSNIYSMNTKKNTQSLSANMEEIV